MQLAMCISLIPAFNILPPSSSCHCVSKPLVPLGYTLQYGPPRVLVVVAEKVQRGARSGISGT